MHMTVAERVEKISDQAGLSVDMLPTSAKVEICGMCSLDCSFCYHKVMKAEHFR